jgi:cytochrome P450
MQAPLAIKINNLLQAIEIGLSFQNDPLGVMDQYFRSFGDVYGIYVNGQTTDLVIRHPQHIQEFLVDREADFAKDATYTEPQRGLTRYLGNGLLISGGDFWKRQRKLMQPAFHHKRIEGYAETMGKYTEEMLANWQDGGKLRIDEEMMKLTLRIVVKALFDSEVASDAKKIGHSMDVFHALVNLPKHLPKWWPARAELRTPRALAELNEVVYRIINERRQDSIDRGDLLSMMLAAEDEAGNRMTDQQLRDESVTLFLAGHETTANLMNWIWAALANEPSVEAKLHEELDAVLAGRTPTLADLKQLPYTEKVVKEGLRMYPPAYAVSRMALRDTQIGPYKVEKNSVVNAIIYFTHHHPDFWENPEVFNPDRFNEQADKARHRWAYLPFGGGPRVCIGNMFALMEAQIMLATIASRYRLRLPAGHQLKMEPMITLRPKNGLPMILEARRPVQQAAKEMPAAAY